MTKREHYLALNCRFQIRLDGLMDKVLDLRIRGREFKSRYGQDFFYFVILGFAPCSPSLPMQMKSIMTYSELAPCFRNKFVRKNMDAVSSGI